MRFEIQPELVTQNKLKWSLSLCMTIPPFAVNTFPVGQAGIMGNKEKILVFMQLTRANNPDILPHQDPMSLEIPVIYNINQNQTMLANLDKGIHNPNLNVVLQHLSNFNGSNQAAMGRSTIYPTI